MTVNKIIAAPISLGTKDGTFSLRPATPPAPPSQPTPQIVSTQPKDK